MAIALELIWKVSNNKGDFEIFVNFGRGSPLDWSLLQGITISIQGQKATHKNFRYSVDFILPGVLNAMPLLCFEYSRLTKNEILEHYACVQNHSTEKIRGSSISFELKYE
jgi:hypothetical protein